MRNDRRCPPTITRKHHPQHQQSARFAQSATISCRAVGASQAPRGTVRRTGKEQVAPPFAAPKAFLDLFRKGRWDCPAKGTSLSWTIQTSQTCCKSSEFDYPTSCCAAASARTAMSQRYWTTTSPSATPRSLSSQRRVSRARGRPCSPLRNSPGGGEGRAHRDDRSRDVAARTRGISRRRVAGDCPCFTDRSSGPWLHRFWSWRHSAGRAGSRCPQS